MITKESGLFGDSYFSIEPLIDKIHTFMRHILITGGNSGIGKTTAKALSTNKDLIVIASKNNQRVKNAVTEIKSISNHKQVYGMVCDLASFDSVRDFAEEYTREFGHLDVLINNAGLITDQLQYTKEGFELQFGVNHLGHFLLTQSLIPLLTKSKEPRIINVSSTAHRKAKINFNSFKGELGPKKYNGMAAYGQSKLANILFTKELARLYPDITSHCLHPGVVSTNIAGKNAKKLWGIMWTILSPFMLNARKGAATTVYLANDPGVLKTNGKYFEKQKEKMPSEIARDKELATKLWKVSEQLIK